MLYSGVQKAVHFRSMHHKTVQAVIVMMRKDSDAAIESFWRYEFVEIWLFSWSLRVPKGFPGASQGGSQGHARGSSEVPELQGLLGDVRDLFHRDNSVI